MTFLHQVLRQQHLCRGLFMCLYVLNSNLKCFFLNKYNQITVKIVKYIKLYTYSKGFKHKGNNGKISEVY